MLYIKCPFCGYRSQKEFAYGGDGTVKRPELNQDISDEKWNEFCLLYTSPSPRDLSTSRMPSSA